MTQASLAVNLMLLGAIQLRFQQSIRAYRTEGGGRAVHLNSAIEDEDGGSQREERLDQQRSFEEAMKYTRLAYP
jgi:hypothetical protein